MGVSKTQMQTKFNGRTVKNRPDPPTFVATPWNQLTVPVKFATDAGVLTRALITTANLTTAILTQIGFPATLPAGVPPLEIRLKAVRAWVTSPDDVASRGLNMDVYDYMDPTTTAANLRLITSISDVAGRNHYANVGFTYPEAHVKYTLGEFPTPVNLVGFDINEPIVVYVYVMYRFQPPQNSVDKVLTTDFELLSLR